MKSKYQVFVSSTYEDLKSERDEVIKAVLEMGHIPVGMEMFSAGDEQQWELIKRQIDDSDYYIVVVAHRYGSLDGGISYTEKEYDYSVSKKIPVLGFLLSDDAKWPANFIDQDVTKKSALYEFKLKIRKKIVNFWKTGDDLHAKVSVSLSKAITAYPRPGWVRRTEDIGPDVTVEISRLSRENSELRNSISISAQQKQQDRREELRRIMELLRKNIVTLSLFFKGSTDWIKGPSVSLLWVFRTLAPEMMIEQSAEDAASFIAIFHVPEGQELRTEWPIPRNIMQEYLADFSALDLVNPSKKKHHLKDENQYWTLSTLGRELYAFIRISDLEREASESAKISEPKNQMEKL